MRRRFTLIAVGLVGVLSLSGCATDALAVDYGKGGSPSFTSTSGLPLIIPTAERTKPIEFTGTTVDGKTLRASDSRGSVTVVNFWYANCAPCRAEAPILQGLYEKYKARSVAFVGVNVFDQPVGALSFEQKYGVTYPSVMDVDSGAARIAFAGAVAPTATPSTFVLDAKGRIAARIVGQLESPSILNTLISDTLAESK